MQFSESWLRSFCNPPLNTQQLADTLTMAGLEVEELRPVAPAFTGVVVGRIVHAEQHPNADRLRICQVDAGPEHGQLSIVCGAPNAREGIRIPCAVVGAVLPPSGPDAKPFHIKLGKLRGVESQGMLCSAKELGIDADASGLLELSTDALVGQSIREHLSLDDTLFTLKLTPNLAHCLSIYGVARELSALTLAPLAVPQLKAVAQASSQQVVVRVDAPDLCGRFAARVVQGVNARAATPKWMMDRLLRSGQRSINALVDISNYVMLELGRPSHMFDLSKMDANSLHVRWAADGETLTLLNDATVKLAADVGVVADANGPLALAGLMGGLSSGVTLDTQDVLIEAAFWWPKAVAGRSRRHGFSSEAGHRFERGVDPESIAEHLDYITQLVLDICGGQAGPIADQLINMPQSQPVQLRVDRASKVIGMPLTQAQCAAALKGLGLAVQEGQGVLTVHPPSFRFDLQIEEDLIEEVVRVMGYDSLPTTPPIAPIVPKLAPENRRSPYEVRRAMAGLGYQETINFSFVQRDWEAKLAGNDNPIALLNPIASHLSVMRSSLMASLLQVAKFNLDRQADRVCVFEIGRVFRKDGQVAHGDTTVQGVNQPMRLAGLAYGCVGKASWEGKSPVFDFYDAKAHVQSLLPDHVLDFEAAPHPALHPGRSARVRLNGQDLGFVGELHPLWKQEWGFAHAPVLFELDLQGVLSRQIPQFKAFSKYPVVERDLAVWVKESVSHQQLMNCIRSAPVQGLLKNAILFDLYRPDHASQQPEGLEPEKSMAVRLVLSRDDASLTEADIDMAFSGVIAHVTAQLGARLRA